jgi:hypothetical protein
MTPPAWHASITLNYTMSYDELHIGMRIATHQTSLIHCESKEKM